MVYTRQVQAEKKPHTGSIQMYCLLQSNSTVKKMQQADILIYPS